MHGQEKLEEAAKAQVRRLCTPKRKRLSLNVPSWVIEEYKQRPKAETAKLLMQCNFDKDMHVETSFMKSYKMIDQCLYQCFQSV